MKYVCFFLTIFFGQLPCSAQSPEQSWWNLLHYTISIEPNYQQKFIRGTNQVKLVALKNGSRVQIDLKEPLRITKVSWKNTTLSWKKKKNGQYIIRFPKEVSINDTTAFTIYFEGYPVNALNPPFDNGWAWSRDALERPWISVACEGSGASIWFPCKEQLYDKPDLGAELHITIPDSLMAVANGRPFPVQRHANGTATYGWKVVNPINNYNIIPYIGKYRHWSQIYKGLKGDLSLDFWVLDYQFEKAQQHFKQVDTLLRAFEYWMGPYPFYKDGYKVVEAPMPGMEHQSAIAYGNHFKNGYNGKDIISGTGWGLKWDFILIHESGHEWFGNSITSSNHSDTWIHEGFAKYIETLYTDFAFGTKAGNEYAIGTWKRIKNDEPIIGSNTTDKYYKASAMLHMIRQTIGDRVFQNLLHKLNSDYYHQTVNTEQILNVFNEVSGMDCGPIFDQYLRTTQVPVFAYTLEENQISYRWENCVDGFAMPVKVYQQNRDKATVLYATTSWKKDAWQGNEASIKIDSNYYILQRQY